MSNREHIKQSRREQSRWRKINTWVAIGAVVLIILLILWLTMADAAGDTDVAAFIAPLF